MSPTMFTVFCIGSGIVLGLILRYREELIDFEDMIFEKVKKFFKK